MKSCVPLLIFLLIHVCPCVALDEAQLAIFREKLHHPDSQVRAATMEQFVDAVCKGDDLGSKDQRDLLPLLASLLEDSEIKVRRRAAELSVGLAMANTTKYPRQAPPATDLKGCPPWQGGLRAALSDSDGRVRDSALSAYALAFPMTPDIQDELVDSYDRERKVETLQNKVPYSLLIDNAPTPKAKALLERLADEPAMAVQLAQMLRGFGKMPPGGLLPRFVQRMRTEEDSNRRDTYFFAVVEYRQQARPFLDDLKRVRQLEPNPVTQKNMERAIQAVGDASPEHGR